MERQRHPVGRHFDGALEGGLLCRGRRVGAGIAARHGEQGPHVVQAREAEFLRVEPGYPVLHIARRHRRAVLEADAQPERVPPGDVTAVRAAQREGKVRDDAGDVARVWRN
jgi:hypothetical protein